MGEQSIFVTLECMEKYLLRIKPRNILVLHKDETEYIKACQKILAKKKIKTVWEAIVLGESKEKIYTQEYTGLSLEELEKLSSYDMVIIPSVLEKYSRDEILEIITCLMPHVIKGMFIMEQITKEGVYNEKLSPIMFNRFNYKYTTYECEQDVIRIYMFVPMPSHPSILLDNIQQLYTCKKKFKLAYWLPHTTLTGGLKTFLEQIRQMTRRGHYVMVYRRGKLGERVLPGWCDLKEDTDVSECILVTTDQPVDECIASDADILVLASIAQLRDIQDFTRRPIVLWEKGYPNLFGEFSDASFQYRYTLYKMRQIYSLPVHIFSVSPTVQEILEYRYGRKTMMLPNGIDTKFYTPNHLEGSARPSITILLIGNPSRKFKRFELAFKLLDHLFEDKVKFKVQWISQGVQPILEKPYTIESVIAPTQEELAAYYRNADILLSTSIYEAFSMPPLEAMASGIAVVATNNGGIMSYARDGENALICEQGDEEGLYQALLKVATDRKLREKLSKNGRQTALEFDYQKIAERFEQLLYSVYCYWYKEEIDMGEERVESEREFNN